MARNKVFIMPVAIDAMPDVAGDVPESFMAVQWMRLLDGEAPGVFVEHVWRVLSADEHPARTPAPPAARSTDDLRLTKPLVGRHWSRGAVDRSGNGPPGQRPIEHRC